MAVRIRSLAASAPVVVPLSTGEAVRLSPGQVSHDMPQTAVANNAKVDKLRRQGLIEVETLGEEPAAAATAAVPAHASPDQQAPVPDAPASGRPRPSKLTEPSG